MTSGDLLVEDPGKSPPSPTDGRRRLIAAAAILLTAGLLVGVAVYWHWRHNARELFTYGGISDTYSAGQVGKSVYVEANVQPRRPSSAHEVLNLRRLRPVVTVNTARASVQLLICVRAPGRDGIGLTSALRPYCASTRPFTPGAVDLGFPVAQIIYAVTARQAGTVRIEGCIASYEIGSRSGNQHVGTGFVDHVRAAG